MGKIEGYLFSFICVFLIIADIVYWFMSHDPTGTTCIALGAGLGALSGGYLTYTARRTGPRPEDRDEAEPSEGAGEVGHFSPGSPWPIAIALSANVFALGLIFGFWLCFIAAVTMLYSVTGLLFEHYRGNHLHTEEAVGIDPITMI